MATFGGFLHNMNIRSHHGVNADCKKQYVEGEIKVLLVGMTVHVLASFPGSHAREREH